MEFKKSKQYDNVIAEDLWDAKIHYNQDLVQSCNSKQEIDFIEKISNYITRFKIVGREKIVVDYCLPLESAKILNHFVTSALIQQFNLNVFQNHKFPKTLALQYVIGLKQECPNWYITFGVRTNPVILTCEYNIEQIKIL